jgi:hypothetical protein
VRDDGPYFRPSRRRRRTVGFFANVNTPITGVRPLSVIVITAHATKQTNCCSFLVCKLCSIAVNFMYDSTKLTTAENQTSQKNKIVVMSDEEDINLKRKKQLTKKVPNRHAVADDSSDDDDLFNDDADDESVVAPLAYSPENLKHAMVNNFVLFGADFVS